MMNFHLRLKDDRGGAVLGPRAGRRVDGGAVFTFAAPLI
jgi:hypothetical protein